MAKLRKNNSTFIKVNDQDFEINADDLIITETPREGWSVMSQDGETVALDLTISPELRSLGLSREVIRLIQETRKNSGFEVSDRINVNFQSSDNDVLSAITQHLEVIQSEVLATSFDAKELNENPSALDEELQLKIWLKKA